MWWRGGHGAPGGEVGPGLPPMVPGGQGDPEGEGGAGQEHQGGHLGKGGPW